MGIGFGELLICGGIVILMVFAAAIWFVVSRQHGAPIRAPMPAGAAPPIPTAPGSRQVIFFLRFEGEEDESYVRDIVARHPAIRDAAGVREAALDLVRAASTATHVFVGPASEAPGGPTLARCGLPGGVVAGFLVHSTAVLSTVADDQDLGKVVGELRAIAAWTDARFAGAQLALANATLDAAAPALVAVRKETRPGHQLCAFCAHAFPAHDTRCPNCGAPASS
ncbi:MAG: hypothetical protein AAGE52_35270 [Myxococcota bacterium]